jgi:hypothetical protein
MAELDLGLDFDYIPNNGSLYDILLDGDDDDGSDFSFFKLDDGLIDYIKQISKPCGCGCGMPFVCSKHEPQTSKKEKKAKKAVVKVKSEYPIGKYKKTRSPGPSFPKESYDCECGKTHFIGKDSCCPIKKSQKLKKLM